MDEDWFSDSPRLIWIIDEGEENLSWNASASITID